MWSPPCICTFCNHTNIPCMNCNPTGTGCVYCLFRDGGVIVVNPGPLTPPPEPYEIPQPITLTA